MASALVTHWVKFDDSSDLRQLAGLTYQPVGFWTSDNVHVRGWYAPSKVRYADATAILVPGRGMGKASLAPLAKMLNDDALNVLLVDMRGKAPAADTVGASGWPSPPT